MFKDTDMNRRRLLALCAGAVGAVAIMDGAAAQQKQGKQQAAAKRAAAEVTVPAGAGRKFFTVSEFNLIDELAEAIIPADEVSGGAKAAKVTEFIDVRLGESFDTEMRQSWRDDLAEIDRLSYGSSGKSFAASSPAERSRLLDRLSRNERNPKEAGEIAFGSIKWQVAFVYYKTRIGIHDELKYLGNTILGEFLGTDPSKT